MRDLRAALGVKAHLNIENLFNDLQRQERLNNQRSKRIRSAFDTEIRKANEGQTDQRENESPVFKDQVAKVSKQKTERRTSLRSKQDQKGQHQTCKLQIYYSE